jgi:hypothetical protein
VVAYSPTQLTVALAGRLPLGDIFARVTTDGVPMAGNPVQLASVVSPTITADTSRISTAPIKLNINGFGFNPANNATNVVTLFSGTGEDMQQLPSNTVVSVLANSATQLTVILNAAIRLNPGVLSATVTTDGVASGDPVQIAQLVLLHGFGDAIPLAPSIDFSANQLAANASTLVITGKNFDANGGINLVQLSTVTGSLPDAVASVVADPSATKLTVTLNPNWLPVGYLGHIYATVTTSSATSPEVQVAEASPASTPTITMSTQSLAENAINVQIFGTGFNPGGGGTNVVSLSSGTVNNVFVASATELLVDFSGITAGQPLLATVTTDGVTSAQQQVATVVASATPTINTNTSSLTLDATTLVITGTGFDSSSNGTILVALNSGLAESVVVNSTTQLTVTLNPATNPIELGDLLALVAVNGVQSDVAQVATVIRNRAQANENYVNSLYGLLLNRAVDSQSPFWVNLLNNGASPAFVVRAIEGSTEFITNEVALVYQTYLHRAPDPTSQFFVSLLQAGASIDQVAAAITGSPEYSALNGGTNSGFLNALYQEVLGRAGDAAGLAYWQQLLAGGVSLGAVTTAFFTSTEYRADLVQANYQNFLRRQAAADEQAIWLQALATGKQSEDVLAGILGSPEGFLFWS